MHTKFLRSGIAMIELIFAIVIMGIVMMSAPMLISTASKSTYVALQQEGINEAASRVHMIMGYAWDENNTQESYIFPILHVTSGNSALDMDGNTSRRTGIPMASQRTFILSDANNSNLFASSNLGTDESTEVKDDIDDFIGDINLTLIAEITNDNDIDYVETTTININTLVSYVPDGNYTPNGNKKISFSPNFTSPPSGTTNIKTITVTLTSTSGIDELRKEIILRAFSCNIGGYTLKERVF